MTLSNYRVLIVDDNPNFVKTLGMLVKAILGTKLTALDTACNGEQALSRLKENGGYNVIFMDVNMPVMDGITATKLINKDYYRGTKIVAVSFSRDFETLSQVINSGAEQYLCKENITLESLEQVFDVKYL